MINSEATNNITFELRNSNGTVIDDTTLSVSMGWQRVNLNFDVPIGNNYQIGVANGNLQTYGLYRNDAGASYPYNIGSAVNITSSSATTAPYSYYYFYYDIEVEIECQGGIAASWDCDGLGNCIDPGTGLGQYSSLVQCQSNCIVPSWDCDGLGNCIDPGTGLGQYSSLVQCQSNCIVPSWDCDGLGNCIDPGTGLGQYSSLVQCQSNCIVPSWDCDGLGNCIDPGTGTGLYNTLLACQSICSTVNINDLGLEKFKIYPNPANNVINIEFLVNTLSDLSICIYNFIGENILLDNINSFSGKYYKQYDLSSYSKGIYHIEIRTDQGIINKKLILQ